MVPFISDHVPMLATAHKEVVGDVDPTTAIDLLGSNYFYDMKWDGVRVLAYVEQGSVVLLNRNVVDVTHRYPDVVAALREVGKDYERIVLDGEIVVFNTEARPDFGLVSRRDRVGSAEKAKRAAEKLPATYVAFDFLAIGEGDLRSVGAEVRRSMLEAHFGEVREQGFAVSPASDDGETLWHLVQTMGLEGVIAKQRLATYESGRSKGWVKVKDTKRASCIVLGYQPGQGKHEGMVGALHLGLIDGSTLVEIGKVGTGFKDDDRARLQEFFNATPDYSPDEIGTLVAEVEYLNVTDDGVLRMPSFKGLRTDVSHTDCTIDQIK